MSKLSYSKSISKKIIDKMSALDRVDTNSFFDNDEEFLFSLCLTYMVLAKEKIIDKEKKNDDPLARLTSNVDSKVIDYVFKPGFASNMPIIYSGNQTDLMWILDNFRDSVSHGAFDIDEANRVIRINNSMHGRNLQADIPFDWFIAYAKYNILNKRITKKTYINNIFYNKKLLNHKHFNTMESINKTLVYSVLAESKDGKSFNMFEIEQRVKNLFHECSMMVFNKEQLNNYKRKAVNYNHGKKYDIEYLEAYFCSVDIVKQTLIREYPNIEFKIDINEKKEKIRRKASKLPKEYTNYSIMCNEFNRLVDRKSFGVIKYLSQLIECFERKDFINYNSNDAYEKMGIFSSMFMGDYYISSDKDILEWFSFNYPLIQTLLLNVYGLNTLVINYEDHFSSTYEGDDPRNYSIGIKQLRNEQFFSNRIDPIIDMIECKVKLFKKERNLHCLRNSGNTSKVPLIESSIQDINNRKNAAEAKIEDLISSGAFVIDGYTEKKKLHDIDKIYGEIQNLVNLFDELDVGKDTLSKEEYKDRLQKKERYKDGIIRLYKRLNDIEKTCFFPVSCNMNEAMRIMRDCFPHPGRITYTINPDGVPIIVMNDYDDNYNKAGEIIIYPDVFLKIIDEPLQNNFGSQSL